MLTRKREQCNVCDKYYNDNEVYKAPTGFTICSPCAEIEEYYANRNQEYIDEQVDKELSHGNNR